MGRFTKETEGRYHGEINVTPLVDIMLVLLIIFMLVSSFVAQQVIKVDLPKASTGAKDEKKSIAVTLSKEGGIFLDGTKLENMAILRTKIEQRKENNPKLQVIIAADRKVAYGNIVDVIDLVRELGIYSFAVNVEYKATE
ncbi:biopolymer transporter ExbD, partial [bacterium]|nr:biopolymer transporter ExbD [bacterium]